MKEISNQYVDNKNKMEAVDQYNKIINLLYNNIFNVFDKIPEPILLIENHKIINCNDGIINLFNYSSKEEVKSKSLDVLFPKEQPDGSNSKEKSLQHIYEALDNDVSSFEWIHKKKEGTTFYSKVLLVRLQIEGENLVLATIRDVTEEKENIQKLKELTVKDPLTGMYNKTYFLKKLDYELNKNTCSEEYISIVLVDIAHFSKINGEYGFNIGDAILNNVAKELNKIFLERDTIARYDGDKFIVLLPCVESRDELEGTMGRLISSIEYLCGRVDEKNISIKVNIGATIEKRSKITSEEIIKHTYMAVDEAKRDRSKWYHFYSPNIYEQHHNTYLLEQDLSRALEKDELFLMYQPIYEIDEGKIVGAEALVRWEHPEFGVIYPNDFIKIAEKNGSIIEIGYWVLGAACDFIKRLQSSQDVYLPISVNISSLQLEQENFVDKLESLIKENKIESSYLEIEITESTAMRDLQYIGGKIEHLQALGVKIAIDDFGTGYSSLSHLHKLKVDKLKIDRSFINNINTDETSKNITANILNIANTFHLATIAEGIETYEQLKELKELKADMFQGFLFSKPLREEELINFIDENLIK